MSDQPRTDDPVARNRATPRRQVPGRVPLGAEVLRRLGRLVGVVVVGATLLMVALLVASRL